MSILTAARDLLARIPNAQLDNEQAVAAESQLSPYGSLRETWTKGMVIDVWAQFHCYLVQPELGLPVIATAAMALPGSPLSQHTHHLYPPGTAVALYRPGPADPYYITGALPPEVTNYGFNRPDWLLEGAAGAVQDDDVHLMALNARLHGGLRDFNADRPREDFPLEHD